MATLTNINGYLYDATGVKVTHGVVSITLQQDMVSVDGTKVAPFTVTVNLATTVGLIDVSIYATVGASPAGLAYFVEYDPDPSDLTKPAMHKDGYWFNYWSVPDVASISLGNFVSALRGQPSANYLPIGAVIIPSFTAQPAHLFFAGPTSGADAIPAFRALTVADLPTVDVPHGGTGVVSLTANGVLYGNGTGVVQVTAQGPANSVLTANAGAPVFSASPTLTNLTVTGTITGNVTGNITGNAATATALQTPRNINGVAFNGTANITVTAAAGTLTGTTLNATVVNSSLTSVGTLATLTVTATITGSVSGNAATATALQTARTINGVSFDGTANITVTAAAGTLTGTTLNATVVSSSLTSVGTLTGGTTGAGFTIQFGVSTLTGTIPTARLGSGTADNTTFLRGDQTWATPAGGGGGTHVLLDSSVHTDTLTGTVVRGDLVVGNSTPKWARLAFTANRFLKGNATDPTWFDLFGTGNTFTTSQTINPGNLTITNGGIPKPTLFLQTTGDATVPTAVISFKTSLGDQRATLALNTNGSMVGFEFNGGTANDGSVNLWVMDYLNGRITHTIATQAIAAAANAYGYWLKPAFTEAGSNTHALIAGMRIDTPNITGAGASVTDTATLYLQGASSASVSGNNWSLFIDAGSARIDGGLAVGTTAEPGAGNISGSGTVKVAGPVFIQATSNANMTSGITIGGSTSTQEILAIKGSNVTHGVTSATETDTFFTVSKIYVNDGGAQLIAFAGGVSEYSYYMQATYAVDNTSKSTSAKAPYLLQAWKKSGTGQAAPGSDANIYAIAAGVNVRIIFDAEGDSHQDGTGWTTYDAEDDVRMVDALDRVLVPSLRKDMLAEDAARFLKTNKAWLQENRIVTFNDDTDGVPFINHSRLAMLHNGAIRALGAAMYAVCDELGITDKVISRLGTNAGLLR